ncbi:MAG: sulfatase [bacterium]|nr:sulfatase [bacterium]
MPAVEKRKKKRDRHLYVRFVLALVSLCLVGSCAEAGRSRTPNVIVIVVDTLRADHLTQYGYERSTSPALERFTAESSLFSAAYSTSSWTQPSVASLFTGLLPSRHGVVKQSTILPAELDTLAGLLSEAGWQTAGFSGNLFIGAKTGFDRGFDHFRGHEGKVLVYPDIGLMLEQVASWLDEGRQRRQPAFLYFQPMNCHGPYRVPEEHRADLLGSAPSRTSDYNDELMTAILKDGDIAARQRVTDEYLASLTDQYDTAVRYSMDAVSRLLEMLEKEGLYGDSLVILTSDHGEELFDHDGFGHGYSLFEEVVRVPLWVKLPGQSARAELELPVSLLDILPTILEVAGIGDSVEQMNLDGRSLAPLLMGSRRASGFRGRPITMDTRWKRRAVASAVRLGRYKLIEIESDYSGRSNVSLLFDLETDSGEQTDLSASEAEMTGVLSQALERIRSSTAGQEPETGEADLDREVLKALGYID